MKNQQTYSQGLLYSVAPEHFHTLHLNDETGKDDFDWVSYEAEFKGASLVQIVLNFLKTTAVNWGIIKLH